ncbi:MAG: diacylglycerol kinase family lipid kinase [Bacteroidales bacterium]|jgi:YegS/Rv2252/BmrU family lipid kinase|nr:diacylglycerol kinase family lipid kinase [Bacteroidales bacterium]NPV36439.1 diacylglycerol kinase family lipid kinase [Bacteroidales bacterium]
MQYIVFIINPISGIHHQRKKKLVELMPQILPKDDFRYEVFYTHGRGDGTALARMALLEGANKIIAVGGDGTVNEVARALTGTDIPLGIIPYGSGNGLANHLKLPRNPEEALRLMAFGNTIAMDTLWLNDELAVSIAGMGFDARVAREYARESQRGFFTYARIAVKEYITYRQREFHISAPGIDIRQRAMLLSIANSDQFGYNTSIAPDASITDGLADITLVKKVPFTTLLITAILLFTRRINKSRYVNNLKLKECTITREKGKYINIDGEPVKMPRTIHLKVVPASLRIIVP